MGRHLLRDNVIILTLAVAFAFFAFSTDNFLTIGNMRNIAINSAILAVVVVPSALLILSGHIDLSVGSTVGLTGTITALAVTGWDWPVQWAILAGVGVGGLVGVTNGLLCSVLNFNPIVVTLGMLSVLRGSTLLITSASLFNLGPVFAVVGRGTFIGIPVLVWFAVVAFALGGIFLRLTPWGRHVYAIGVNTEAAFLAGISVRRLPFILYVATGVAGGIGGLMAVSRLDGAAPAQLGLTLELMVLTAVLVGGVAFAGGRGSLSGVFFAVLLLGVLQNGLVLMNVSTFVQKVAEGVLLVVAAGVDSFWVMLAKQRRRRLGSGERGERQKE